jgi:RND family efflux transporter MFP subunit
MEKVLEVNFKSGQAVHKGDVLIRLDNQSLKAEVGKAQGGLDSAKAARDHAKVEFEATDKAFKAGAATKTDLDRADNAYKSAQADVQRLEEALNSAKISLDYSVIYSPMDGVIIDKKVNVGDTAMPGQVLLTLYDPQRMQLVARVRESLAQRLKVGQQLDVQVSSDKPLCRGTVTEIVPEAESASRTFSVKVSGPCEPGVYAGTFGRLRIPLDTQDVLVIPVAAVTHVGQLDTVRVVVDGKADRRSVRLGRLLPEQGNVVEVLSGLAEGEKVVMGAMATASSRGHASSSTVHAQPEGGLAMPPGATTEASHE